MKPMKQFNYPDPFLAQQILLPQPFPINKLNDEFQTLHVNEELPHEQTLEDPSLKNVPLEERFNILKKE